METRLSMAVVVEGTGVLLLGHADGKHQGGLLILGHMGLLD